MTFNYLIKKLNKFKILIVITIIVSFMAGFLLALFVNESSYQSLADVNYFRLSNEIANSFDENYYYFFFRYYASDENFASEVVTDHHTSTDVMQSLHEYLFDIGYNISYEEMTDGITTYMRTKQNRKRVTITYNDPELTKIVLHKLNELAAIDFTKKMTNRMIVEIEHRYEKEDKFMVAIENNVQWLLLINNELEDIEDNTRKEQLEVDKIKVLKTLDALRQVFEENKIQILRLEQTIDFPFNELLINNIDILEEGVLVNKSLVNVGFVTAILCILIWMFVFAIIYIKREIKE